MIARQLTGRADQIPFIFLGAAVALVGLGDLTLSQAAAAVNLPVLAFLFSMFVFAVALDRAGAMAHLALWLASRARRGEDLVLYLFVGFGLVSTVLVNDALVVIMVPFLLHLAKRLNAPPVPLLLTLAFGVTVGSALTPLGNPQNLLIALSSGMQAPISTFLRYLLLPILASLLLGGLLLRRMFRSQFQAVADGKGRPVLNGVPLALFPRGGWLSRIRRYPSLVIFPATLVSLVVFEVLGSIGVGPKVPIYMVAAAGATILLLVQPAREQLMARLDWSTLLLFVGLFVVMAGEVNAGVVAVISRGFPVVRPGGGGSVGAAQIGSILLSSALGSQLFSNVPWVALSLPTLQALGYNAGTPVAWIALAAGSTLAGNVTLLGAVSNLIIANQAERGGVRIRLGEFVRWGLPVAGLSIGLVFLMLVLGL